MTKLYNTKTGALEDIPDNQVDAAFAQGTHGFKQGQEIPAISDKGEKVWIPAEKFKDAQEWGYRFETSADRTKEDIHKEYGTGPLASMAAAGLATARGLSLGASDAILANIPGVDMEAVNAYKEENKGISAGFEYGSMIIPSLMTAGTSLLGRVAVKAGLKAAGKEILEETVKTGAKKAGFVMGAAESVGEGVGKFATSKMEEGLLKESIASGVNMATQGLIYNAGTLASEASLGNKDLTAEGMLSEVVLSDAMAGGIGVLLPGAGKFIKKGAGATTEVFKKVFPDGSKLSDMMRKVVVSATEYDDKVIQEYFKNPERISNAIPHDQLAVIGADINNIKKINEHISNKTSEALSTLVKAEGKPLMSVEDLDNVLLKKKEELLANKVSSQEAKDYARIIDEFRAQYAPAPGGKVVSEGDRKILIDMAKRSGQLTDEAAAKYVDDMAMAANQARTVDPLMIKRLIRNLDDFSDDIWAKVPIGGKISSAESSFIGVRQELDSFLKTKFPGYEKSMKEVADLMKVKDSVRRVFGNPNMAEQRMKTLFKKGMSESGELTLADAQNIKKYGDIIGTDITQHYRDRKVLELFDKNMTRGSKSVNMIGAMGAGLGHVIDSVASSGEKHAWTLAGIPLGAMIGHARDKFGGLFLRKALELLNRHSKFLDSAGKVTGKYTGEIGSAVSEFLKSGAIKPAAIKYGSKSTLLDSDYEDAKNHVMIRGEGLDKMINDFDSRHTDVNYALPETTTKAKERMLKATKVLQGSFPKPVTPDNPLTPFKPSKTQWDSYKRTAAAIENPKHILDEIRSGHVSPESIKVLAEIYPATHAEIKKHLIDKLAENPKVTYAKKAQIMRLIGAPLDNSLAAMPILQRNAQENTAAGMQPKIKPENVKIAERGSSAFGYGGKRERA